MTINQYRQNYLSPQIIEHTKNDIYCWKFRS